SALDAGASVLLVSQFTLHGDVRRGRRPSFINAAKEPASRRLYELTGALIQEAGVPVSYGVFGAQMEVELVNSGPVTILIDTKRTF
ncbi:MAG TPA: D-aminoacyl-tRNA deacylase, partial [Candidatus Cybelea sp.]|nr:D-aminoacyl-tRNA deacylase [Candidatus Cybelea sp.]